MELLLFLQDHLFAAICAVMVLAFLATLGREVYRCSTYQDWD
jgi:hypothetical protein